MLGRVARLAIGVAVVRARHVAAGRLAPADAPARETLPLAVDTHERLALVCADLLTFLLLHASPAAAFLHATKSKTPVSTNPFIEGREDIPQPMQCARES